MPKTPLDSDAPTGPPNSAEVALESATKRRFVLQELVDSEKDYVKDLGLIVDGFMATLQQMDLPENLRGKDRIIFANIEQIYEFHKKYFLIFLIFVFFLLCFFVTFFFLLCFFNVFFLL